MNPAVTPQRIDAAYQELGYGAGWRFMTCPVANFAAPKALLVSLNPSGRVEHGPRWSQELGSAYIVESWDGQPKGGDSLQIRIQGLVQYFRLSFDEVASAHFVPFRSQRWADLDHKSNAVAFSHQLWRDFVTDMEPDYVICLGTKVGEFIPDLFGVKNLTRRKTGWGEISMSVGGTRSGGQLVILPHLGTFKLFSRPECRSFLMAAIGPQSAGHA